VAIEAVISDLDGTLVDSERVYLAATRAVIAPALIEDAIYEAWIGRGGFSEWIETTYGVARDGFRARVLEEFARALELDSAPAIDGAHDLLASLTARGLPLAVASQSSHALIEASLRATKLAHHFSVVVSVQDVANVGKPAPDVYLHAASRLGVPAAACLAIEDSVVGVRSALAAGMRVVQSRGTSFPAPPQPGVHAVIESLREFDPRWLA
jgi:HAD superfamily hydrolase (TIGR01509 family)